MADPATSKGKSKEVDSTLQEKAGDKIYSDISEADTCTRKKSDKGADKENILPNGKSKSANKIPLDKGSSKNGKGDKKSSRKSHADSSSYSSDR